MADEKISPYDELVSAAEIERRFGLRAGDFAELVERGIFAGPTEGDLWLWQRVSARRATLIKSTERPGIVYVVGFAKYVKIGFTAQGNLQARLISLQTGCPEQLEVFGEIVGSQFDEVFLLGRFIAYRTSGEWHRREGELAKWIEAGCPHELPEPEL